MVSSDFAGIREVVFAFFFLLSNMFLFDRQGVVRQTKIGCLESNGMLAIGCTVFIKPRKLKKVVLQISNKI